MPSKLEQLRQESPNSRLNDRELLYNEYDETDKKISFTQFIEEYTQGEEQLSGVRSRAINVDWYNPEAKETAEVSSFIGGLEGTPFEQDDPSIGQKILQTLPKEPRRMVGGFYDILVSGAADLTTDVGAKLNPTNLKLPEKFKKETKDIYTQALGSTFGHDLINVTQDKEGEYHYALEEPETTIGSLSTNIGAFFAAMRSGKNPIKSLTTPKPKAGRPPKEGSAAYFKKLKKERRIGTAQTIAAAELAGQIVIDPEEGRLAYRLGQWAGESDSMVASILNPVFEYLDLEDPAELSAMENRLGLLAESLTAGGILVGGVKGFIGTLKGIKKTGDVAVRQFKKTAESGRKSDRAFKVKEDVVKDKPFLPAKLPSVIENSRFGQTTQQVVDLARSLFRKGFTSKGIQTEKMFSIINQAENSKIALSESALDTVAKIEYSLKSAAKEIAIKTSKLPSPLKRFDLKARSKAYQTVDKQFRGFLTGEVYLKDLPKYLHPLAREVQKDIKTLSRAMINNPHVPDKMKKEIAAELGKYLRTTYEIFENPNWTPSRAVQLDAINLIAKSLRNTKNFRPQDGVDDAGRLQEAKNTVRDLLKKKGKASESARKHLDQMFGTKTADKLFANKKNIAPEIRALLGETKGAPTSVFRTLTTVSHYLTEVKMYDDLLAAGKGKYFFDSYRAGTVKITGKQFHALDGKRTTPELAKMFDKQSQHIGWKMKAYNKALIVKGFGQASATVLNNITHLRNTIGQSIIMAENGLNPFGAETSKSFKVLANNFKNVKNQDKAVRDLYKKYQRLGLVNQNVKVNEFKRIINEASFGTDRINAMIGQSLTRRGFNLAMKPLKSAYKGAEKLYVAEDDLFRIAAYEKELLVLKEANLVLKNKMTIEQLERKAAEIIRDTMPTYDLIPVGAKALRKMPFGNFFAFAAERFRNTYHTFKRSRDEIFSGNKVLEARGYNRLAGKIGIGLGGGYAIGEGSKILYGVGEDIHRAYKDLLLPEWSKNSQIAYFRNEKGELMYFDLSYTDPDAPVLDVMRAGLNEFLRKDRPTRGTAGDIGAATVAGMKRFFEPFVSEALISQAAVDVIFGKGISESGRRIPGWDEGASEESWNNIEAAFMYMGNVLIPAAYKNLMPEAIGGKKGSLGELVYRDLTDKPAYRRFDGTQKDMDIDLLANTTGFRFYKIDDDSLNMAANFKIRDFKKNRETYQNDLNDLTTYNNTYEDVINQFIEINTNYYYTVAELTKTVRAAQVLNVNVLPKLENLRFSRNEEKNALIQGSPYFTPLRFTIRQYNDILEKTTATSKIKGPDAFRMILAKLEEQFNALPLVDLEADYRKESYSEKFPREAKFAGGEIDSKYPVTSVPPNPSDRDLSNQNISYEEMAENINPYKQDMDRLGFKEGKEAALDKWYALQEKQQKQKSSTNRDNYENSIINKIEKHLGVTLDRTEALTNLNQFKNILGLAESTNREKDLNLYQQRPASRQDAYETLEKYAPTNNISKEFLDSIDIDNPESWDDPTADVMMLAYFARQPGSYNYLGEILQGNFGTAKEGPFRSLYEGYPVEGKKGLFGWVRKSFPDYVKMHPDTDPEGNLSRAFDEVINRQKFYEGERVGVETDYGSTKVKDKDIKNLLKDSLALLQPSNDISLEDIQKSKRSLWSGPDKFPIEEDIFMNNLMPLLKTKQGNMASSAWREHKALIPLTEAVIRDYLYPQEESRYNEQYPNYPDAISMKPAMNAMSWHLQQERDRQDEGMNPTKLADILTIPLDMTAELASSLLSRRE